MTDLKKILDEMGEAATLELLAEECTELAQAALKMARKKRGENPTPVSSKKCVLQLLEEIADVCLCLQVLDLSDWYDDDYVKLIANLKLTRWKNRMGM